MQGTVAPPAILVVDDDDLLRFLVSRSLVSDGFEVHAASSLVEARAALETRAFDVVLLDRKLQNEDGLDLVPALACASTAPRLLVTSGAADAGQLPPGAAFIAKPYRTAALTAQVKALLDVA
jgi:DNA-binding response OmpR family regulator